MKLIKELGAIRKGRALYGTFECDCGKEFDTMISRIKSGKISGCSSCAKRTHGETKTRLHKIWVNMRYRCSGVNGPDWDRYGGRGISVCSEWDNFLKFKSWAESNGYADDLTIEREDVDGNYEPSNCSWESRYVQAMNKTNSSKIQSKELGVIFHKQSGKWNLQIKKKSYGLFDTEAEAINEKRKLKL